MIELAIEVATKAHDGQYRKGTKTPYIFHPYTVAMMLMKEGVSDEIIIAALLHDTVEDTDIDLEYIREIFGEKIAFFVEGCSEPNKSLPWEERKKHTIEYLKGAPLEVCMIAYTDKLHNLRTTIEEHRKIGEEIWDRFNRGKDKQKWYYKSLVEVLYSRKDIPENFSIFKEFIKEVDEFFSK